MVGDILRSIILWWRNVSRPDKDNQVDRKVLISLSDDEVVLGRLCSVKSHVLMVDQASVSNQGKIAALPHPSTVLVPMRRVVMVQYLEDIPQIEMTGFGKGDK